MHFCLIEIAGSGEALGKTESTLGYSRSDLSGS